MRHLSSLGMLGILCLFGTHQAQAQHVSQGECGGDYVCIVGDSAPVTTWAAGREPQMRRQSSQGARLANLAPQERCAEASVDVTAASADERRLVCAAADDALQLLGRCRISLQRPLHVQVMKEVRHPLSGVIFGLFDPKQERVFVTQEEDISSLVRDTPYSRLPPRDFYRSVIVHEVIHGVMHQNSIRPAMNHAAYEYPAYALQIESLPPGVRDEFLESVYNNRTRPDDFVFNDIILSFDPFFFAARAYEHFKASPDRCAHLSALLAGEIAFIPTLLPLSP